jgi:hypothetical protein
MTTVKKGKAPAPAQAASSPEVHALTKGMHTFHLADSNASYTYTDADAKLVKEAFAARVAVEKADEKLAPTLVRIFGADWTKEGAASELKKPVREFIRAVLPEYQAIVVARAQYAAAAKAGAVDNAESTRIRVASQAIESKITRMIEQSSRIWRDHLAAQDPDFVPESKSRNIRTGQKILEKAQEDLEKRAGKSVPDADACKVAAMLVGQVAKGRGGLFIAAMRFGATHKLSDSEVALLLKALPVEIIGKILTDAKAAEKAAA